jgi:uncharacterized protein YecT (DUF1311 family)|tara:strand:- start:828 stop:1535 length:708 start_codon:yes stop_codon:yes gene_type:complete
MFKHIRFFSATLLFSIGFNNVITAASFDCNKASTATEHAICDYPELSALDDIMGETYRSAKTSADWLTPIQLKNTQRSWIKSRNKCGNKFDCLRDSYVQRLEEISDGVFFLTLGRNFASFVYEGDPISGICPPQTQLSDWGQCVSWFRGGSSFRGVSISGAMAFNFDYIGANAHMCSLSGHADKVNGQWIYQDNVSACTLRIELGRNGLSLNPTRQCNSYCGMRAQGAMEQIIEY